MDQPTTELVGRLERKNRGRRLRSVLMVVGLATLATGCASATLQHPQSGQRVKCGPYGMDNTGVGLALLNRCISDYQRQGYERVPE